MSYEVLLFHPHHGFVCEQKLTPQPLECVIVGTHERADLRIEHPLVWPRHLAIVVTNCPVAGIRVLDLVKFSDAVGRQGVCATAEETLAVNVAGYVVVVRRESGNPLQLPDPAARPFTRPSLSDAARHLLVVSYNGRVSSVYIGTKAAAAGFVIGRSTRSDDRLRALRHPAVSRVHAVVVELGQRLYWCDTATTHGTWYDSERVKVHELDTREQLLLPHGAAVSWEPLY